MVDFLNIQNIKNLQKSVNRPILPFLCEKMESSKRYLKIYILFKTLPGGIPASFILHLPYTGLPPRPVQ